VDRPISEQLVRPRLVTPALLRVFGAAFAGLSSFFLLLSVAPLYATSAGAGEIGAGATTAALFSGTVAAELMSPRLVHRFGYRLVFAVGLLLLGLPALALTVSSRLAAIVALSAVRGLGFGIVVVLGAALVASMVPASRRGEGFGVFGLVIGVPGVLALPFGVFLVDRAGFAPVLVAGALVALGGLITVSGLPGRRSTSATEPTEPVGILAVARSASLRRPALVFSTTAMAAGVIVTFLALATSGASADLVALGLLLYPATSMIARWFAGRYADRHDASRLLIPALLTAAAGVFALVLVANPVAMLVGTVLFGTGFGTCQTATLVLMFNRVPRSRYGQVSAMWNLAFDAGMGLGAAGFGVLAAQVGFPVSFAVLASVMLVALLPAVRDRLVTGRRHPTASRPGR
jgi:predicted MFS family arabinose efflux permease